MHTVVMKYICTYIHTVHWVLSRRNAKLGFEGPSAPGHCGQLWFDPVEQEFKVELANINGLSTSMWSSRKLEKDQRIELASSAYNCVIIRVVQLFRGHRDLILGFNA